MARDRVHSRTFKTVLRHSSVANSVRLMERARLANRIAKMVKGRSRTKAYQVKHRALIALAARLPRSVEIKPDPSLPEFVIVNALDGHGLHLPRITLSGGITITVIWGITLPTQNRLTFG